MSDYEWVSIDEISKPIEGLNNAYLDRWWVSDGKGNVLIYKEIHPQCNKNKVLVERLLRITKHIGSTEPVQVPAAFIRARAGDYV